MASTGNTSGDRKPWTRTLHLDQYIDVLDTADKWSEAVVIGLTQHKVQVHFRGWPPKYNEWIPFDSSRLAPGYTRVRNWRMLKKGDHVQLATAVSGAKTPVWRNGVVKQTRRGRSDSPVPASVLVQLDGDRETRWVDTEEDCLCAAGTHQVRRRENPTKRSTGGRRQDDGDDGDDDDDSEDEEEEPGTIDLLDDDDDEEESDAAMTESSDEDAHPGRKHARARGAKAAQAKRPLTRAATKPAATSTPSLPPAPRTRRDGPKESPLRKRKHNRDDDDFATWREGLTQGSELEVADEKLAQWYDARVCDVRGKREVCVRFRGWPWQYDEWLPRSSPRLAPLASHLGRWRDFATNQSVQIGFRASAKAEAPSHWETGVVATVSRAAQSQRVKRLEITWTSDDGTTMREWREGNDDLLAPIGMPTWPLPKKTADDTETRGGSGGPAFGRSLDDEDDDDDAEMAVDLGLELPDDPDDAGGSHEALPPSLADRLPLTPDDIAKAIDMEPPASAPTATSATAEATPRRVATAPTRQKIQTVIMAAVDAFKGTVVAALDAAYGAARPPAASVNGHNEPPAALALASQPPQDDTDDTQAAPVAKRARRKRDESTGTEVGAGTATGGAGTAGVGVAEDAPPAEI